MNWGCRRSGSGLLARQRQSKGMVLFWCWGGFRWGKRLYRSSLRCLFWYRHRYKLLHGLWYCHVSYCKSSAQLLSYQQAHQRLPGQLAALPLWRRRRSRTVCHLSDRVKNGKNHLGPAWLVLKMENLLRWEFLKWEGQEGGLEMDAADEKKKISIW